MSWLVKRELRRGLVVFNDVMVASSQQEAEEIRSYCIKAQLGEGYQLYTEPSRNDADCLIVYRVVEDVGSVLTVASQSFTITEEN